MINTLKSFFDQLSATLSHQASPADPAQSLRLATAVLLVEVMRADPAIKPAETEAALRALRGKFGLNDTALQSLLDLAHGAAASAHDLQTFTSQLNTHFTQPQKIAVVQAMWEVAYADGQLDAHERHLISKVAGLLHVTHGEYIGAKLRAEE